MTSAPQRFTPKLLAFGDRITLGGMSLLECKFYGYSNEFHSESLNPLRRDFRCDQVRWF
jgi:hypothetical protein